MRIVLLDADVIIDLHQFGIWKNIVKKNKILISSIILRQEVYYYEDKSGIKHQIDLSTDIDDTIEEISVTAEALSLFRSFEMLLRTSGITKKLETKHTETYFKKYLDEGSILRIQKTGFEA